MKHPESFGKTTKIDSSAWLFALVSLDMPKKGQRERILLIHNTNIHVLAFVYLNVISIQFRFYCHTYYRFLTQNNENLILCIPPATYSPLVLFSFVGKIVCRLDRQRHTQAQAATATFLSIPLLVSEETQTQTQTQIYSLMSSHTVYMRYSTAAD